MYRVWSFASLSDSCGVCASEDAEPPFHDRETAWDGNDVGSVGDLSSPVRVDQTFRKGLSSRT